jgi:hypothetical protein
MSLLLGPRQSVRDDVRYGKRLVMCLVSLFDIGFPASKNTPDISFLSLLLSFFYTIIAIEIVCVTRSRLCFSPTSKYRNDFRRPAYPYIYFLKFWSESHSSFHDTQHQPQQQQQQVNERCTVNLCATISVYTYLYISTILNRFI